MILFIEIFVSDSFHWNIRLLSIIDKLYSQRDDVKFHLLIDLLIKYILIFLNIRWLIKIIINITNNVTNILIQSSILKLPQINFEILLITKYNIIVVTIIILYFDFF